MQPFRLDSPRADHAGRAVVSACFGEDLEAEPGDLVYGISVDGTVVSHLDLYWKTIHVGEQLVDVAAIGQVGTLPDHRGRGFASALVEAAHEDSKRHVPYAGLFGSLAFYGRFGYRETNLTDELGFLLCPLSGEHPAIGEVELDGQRW